MFAKVIIFTLLNLLLIAFEYKKSKNIKKSIITTTLLIYILLMGYIGFFALKAYLPLKFIHFIILIFDYFAFIFYLFKNKLYWQIFLLPIITVAIYFSLDFIAGSRYE